MLLRNANVRKWIVGDTGFLKDMTNCKSKLNEDTWGREVLKMARPDLSPRTMWTGQLGQEIVRAMFPDGWKPDRKQNFEPDWETNDFVIEIKTQSWFTDGTAAEKILGVFIKYKDVPNLYNKPLRIIGIAKAGEYITHHLLADDPKLNTIRELAASWRITYEKLELPPLDCPGSLNLSLVAP